MIASNAAYITALYEWHVDGAKILDLLLLLLLFSLDFAFSTCFIMDYIARCKSSIGWNPLHLGVQWTA